MKERYERDFVERLLPAFPYEMHRKRTKKKDKSTKNKEEPQVYFNHSRQTSQAVNVLFESRLQRVRLRRAPGLWRVEYYGTKSLTALLEKVDWQPLTMKAFFCNFFTRCKR